jgi:ankyrin repeat protein
VKGRAPHARYYLEGTLTWIAQNENADFKGLVDVQDEHGDTALNIAARVGNRGIVRILLDAGANRMLPNKLGLRPGDFGLDQEVSAITCIDSYRPTSSQAFTSKKLMI